MAAYSCPGDWSRHDHLLPRGTAATSVLEQLYCSTVFKCTRREELKGGAVEELLKLTATAPPPPGGFMAACWGSRYFAPPMCILEGGPGPREGKAGGRRALEGCSCGLGNLLPRQPPQGRGSKFSRGTGAAAGRLYGAGALHAPWLALLALPSVLPLGLCF